MKVIHVIGSLSTGGAETQLSRLAIEQAKRNYEVQIFLFNFSSSPLQIKCAENNVKIVNLDLRRGTKLSGVLKLFRELDKADQPGTIFQSWMYFADLLISIWGLFRLLRRGSKANIFWNIRCTLFSGKIHKNYIKYFPYLALSLLSYIVPRKIVCCANSAKLEHEKWLYDKSKMVVIHNCFDDAEYSAEKETLQDSFILGFVARNDPIKNFPVFVNIMSNLILEDIKVKAHIAGRDYNPSEEVPPNIKKYFDFKGEISKMSNFYKNIDLLVVTSFSEGFPNVIVEAGLSGVDCISFDVGDVSYILPDRNIIKNRSIETMLYEIKKYIRAKSAITRLKNRDRLLGKFSINSTADLYEKMYLDEMDKRT